MVGKPKVLMVLLCLTLMAFLLAACGEPLTAQIDEASPQVASQTAPQSALSAETPTPSLSPSNTSSPTDAELPTATIIPSPTQITDPTDSPTLGLDEKLTFVEGMLATNGGCELPCWWSIIPGETRWEEMQTTFTEKAIPVSENGHLDLSYGDTYLLSVEYQQGDGLVEAVNVESNSNHPPFTNDFTTTWGSYALKNLLSAYGVPSQVYLSLEVGAACLGPGIVPTYSMWVVYDHLGISVRYQGELLDDPGGWLVCPVFGHRETIEIHLQSPSTGIPLVELPPADDFTIRGNLGELTGMSLDEFHWIFSQPDPQTCMLGRAPSWWGTEQVLQPPPSAPFTPDLENMLIFELLFTDGGCELPCWWGITPGKTSLDAAREQFFSYGKSIGVQEAYADYWDEEGDHQTLSIGDVYYVGIFGRHDPYPYDYVIRHVLYPQDGVVGLLGVMAHAPGRESMYSSGWPPTQHFTQDWERFTLAQVLARYGAPSQVLLHYWPHEGALYSLGLLYEQRGFMVTYMGAVQGRGEEEYQYALDQAIICPSPDQISDINLWLKSPNMGITLTEIFNNWEAGAGPYILPFNPLASPGLEEATSMNLDTFYQTYLDPQTDICLEASSDFADQFP